MMDTIETRIRAAARAAAHLVADDSAPPLELNSGLGRARRSRPGRLDRSGRRVLRAVLTPLAAAAAVVAVIVASVAVGGSNRPARPPGTGSLLDQVPRYYMQLVPGLAGEPSYLALIRNTVTGATLATIRPPRSTGFASVVAAANDRTFALVVQSQHTGRASDGETGPILPDSLEIARFNPAGNAVSLSAVRMPTALFGKGPFPEQPHVVYQVLSAIALSPTGNSLAVATTPSGYDIPNTTPAQLTIYSLAGRPARTWQLPGPPSPDTPPELYALSWGTSGALAFNLTEYCDPGCPAGTPPSGVWVLDIRSRGTSLVADSRFIVPFSSRYGNIEDIVLTANGDTIVGSMSSAVMGDFQEFSVRTGREIRELWYTRDGGHLEWSNALGSVLVVLAPSSRNVMAWILGAVSGNRIVRIPDNAPRFLIMGFTTDVAF
jgi:hypothetical protein